MKRVHKKNDHPLLGRRLVVIIAHPDDEAYLAAGTAYLNAERGGKTAVICGTAGEKGKSHLKRKVSSAQLRRMRCQELEAACASANIQLVHQLYFPDGALTEHRVAFQKRSLALATSFKPDCILTFGPEGFTAHRDHIVCWKVSQGIARSLKCRLFMFTVAVALAPDIPTWLHRRRVHGKYETIKPYQPPTVRIGLPPGLKKKVLKEHRSQLDAGDPYPTFPRWAAKRMMAAEYFAEMK